MADYDEHRSYALDHLAPDSLTDAEFVQQHGMIGPRGEVRVPPMATDDPCKMRDYLDSLRVHGHQPGEVTRVTIGRGHYIAGRFVSPERPAPAGSRAAAEGRPIPSHERIALMATDGRNVVPASYRRSSRVHYVTADGQRWFVSGWSADGDVMWLDKVDAGWVDHDGWRFAPYREVPMV